jgi:hypothetical protein
MRNPLSAIVQSADVRNPSGLIKGVIYLLFQSIITSHKAHTNATKGQSMLQAILETSIDAAETIVQCSQHMKCIVDGLLSQLNVFLYYDFCINGL